MLVKLNSKLFLGIRMSEQIFKGFGENKVILERAKFNAIIILISLVSLIVGIFIAK